MPAKSKKQQRFMAAVANNPKFAKKVGVPKSVGEEFMKKGYMGGGMMRRYASGGKLDMVEKDGKMVPFYAADGKGKMMGGGKVQKYQRGSMVEMMDGMDSPGEGMREEDIRLLQMGDADRTTSLERMSEDMGSKKKAPKKKNNERKIPLPPARPKGMKHGGKVRGCGAVSKKMRPAKMVVMKGS